MLPCSSVLVSMLRDCFNGLCLFQCPVLVSMLCACFNALCLFQCSVLVSLLDESMTCALSPSNRIPTRRVPTRRAPTRRIPIPKTSENLGKITTTSGKRQTRTRRHANNPGNRPGPRPIAPRDEISRSGEPVLAREREARLD